METMIAVQQGDVLAAIRGFLRKLLENGVVEALLVPLESENGSVAPALVTDPERLISANPLAPVMPINAARALAAVTGKATPATLGAVLRPCEIRAAIELVKLQQATLDGVILISFDCPGTYEGPDYRIHQKDQADQLAEYLSSAKAGQDPTFDGMALRPACQMCVQQIPENVAIHLHLFGADTTTHIPVTIWDQLAAALDLHEPASSAPDHAAYEQLQSAHHQAREKALAEIRQQMASSNGFASLFANCIGCHNCKTACPICYCKVCLFDSDSLRHDPAFYIRSAQRKGALRLMPDTLLFHLTRLNHMSLSCVGCGMCSSACPEQIPVFTIFTAVGTQVQQVFDYQPGLDVETALPLTSYQPGEWVEVGEEK